MIIKALKYGLIISAVDTLIVFLLYIFSSAKYASTPIKVLILLVVPVSLILFVIIRYNNTRHYKFIILLAILTYSFLFCFVILFSLLFIASGSIQMYLGQNADSPFLCSLVGDHKIECYNRIALEKNNPEFCSLSEKPDNCYINIAMELMNISICEYYISPDYCISEIAKRYLNPMICNNISSNESRYSCKERVFEYLSGRRNVSDCKSVDEKGLFGKCSYQVSRDDLIKFNCTQLVNEDARIDCLLEKSRKGQDKESCFILCENGVDYPCFYCLHHFANTGNDSLYCDKMLEFNITDKSTLFDSCLSMIARKKSDLSYCANTFNLNQCIINSIELASKHTTFYNASILCKQAIDNWPDIENNHTFKLLCS